MKSINWTLPVVTLALIMAGVLYFNSIYREPIPAYDKDILKINTDEQQVIGFQIKKNENGLIYLALEGTSVNVYSISGKETPKIINTQPIPIRPEVAKDISFAKSFVDVNDNIYFETDLTLVRIDKNNSIKTYKYLGTDLLHTDTEIQTKSHSKLVKRIIEKYSVEPIQGISELYADSELILYFIDIDKGYYILSGSNPLSLERFSVVSEDVNTISETIKIAPNFSKLTNSFIFDNPVLLNQNSEKPMFQGKTEIKHHCYKTFMPIDGPSCRATRIHVFFDGKKYVLPNYEDNAESIYNTPFVYLPYDKNFSTNGGDLYFLSYMKELYKVNNVETN